MEITLKSYDAKESITRATLAIDSFEKTGNVYFLLYSALDTRLCIERTLFEYLVLIKTQDIAPRLERLYSASDLKKAILKEEPVFFKKLEFLRLFAKYLPYEKEIVIPDLDLLSQTYGRTNNYLHCPKRPAKTWQKMDWWLPLVISLKQTIPHLEQILSSPMAHINLNPMGTALFEKFVSGEITSDEVTKILGETFKERPPIKVKVIRRER
jgi:hypothetical protein